MATDFVKVYRKFFLGSMRDTPPWTRLTFLALLSLADDTGMVDSTPAGIAGFGAIPTEDVEKSLAILEAPDEQSSTPDEQGRRIVREGPNRWRIVNYRRYYEANRAEERKAYLREAKRRERAAKKEPESTDVNKSQHVNPKRKEKKETQIKGNEKKTPNGVVGGSTLVLPDVPSELNTPSFHKAWQLWLDHKKERGQKMPPTTIKSQLEFLAEHPDDAVEIIKTSIRNKWQGLFPLKKNGEPRGSKPIASAVGEQLERMGISKEDLFDA